MESFVLPSVITWDGMDIPIDFPYLSAILQGPPTHDHDEFALRHPRMERGKRAKIFAPFDALDGYSDAVKSKNIEYTVKTELSDEEHDELARRLGILHKFTCNGRIARQNHIVVTVTYYVPCEDENNFSFGIRGLYKSVTGICWKVDFDETMSMTVDAEVIFLDSISSIEVDNNLFDTAWEIERS